MNDKNKTYVPQINTPDGLVDLTIDSTAIGNLKTINGEDIRGTGDIQISGATDIGLYIINGILCCKVKVEADN